MAFAEGTTVSPEKSRAEIEALLRKYGADQFMSGYDAKRAMIGFRCKDRFVRFRLQLPQSDDPRLKGRRPRRRWINGRWETGASGSRLEAETRRRWRALCLVLKAKLEAVESGIETFDEAFLPHIVMPGGATFADVALPAVVEAYQTGKMPALLPGIGETGA